MRSTIILGTLVALLGFAPAAQADDQSDRNDNGAVQVTREISHSGRGDRHHRYEDGRRSRDRHHESREHRRTSRETNETNGNDEAHEAREHR